MHTATTDIYTLSLHDALPILLTASGRLAAGDVEDVSEPDHVGRDGEHRDRSAKSCDRRSIVALRGDRKSTRLNSSHTVISYAVFCLKKKKNNTMPQT